MQYPLKFTVKSLANCGVKEIWRTESEGGRIICAIPTAFQGSGGGFSPEDLLGFAALNCFIGTFKVFAEKNHLTFDMLRGEATVEVDRLEKRPLAITRIDLQIALERPSDRVKAEELLKEAEKNCMVLNSLNVEKRVSFVIS